MRDATGTSREQIERELRAALGESDYELQVEPPTADPLLTNLETEHGADEHVLIDDLLFQTRAALFIARHIGAARLSDPREGAASMTPGRRRLPPWV